MITLIFLLFFPFALWQAWKNLQLAKASPSWPTVEGVVTTSERGRVALRTQPRVAYSYTVNGNEFTSKRVSFVGGVPKAKIDEVLSHYPIGHAVTVHYQPEKPSEAVLEPGSGPPVVAQFKSLLVMFVVVVVINAILLVVRWDELTGKKPHIRTYGDTAQTADAELGDRLIRQDAEKGSAPDQFLVGAGYVYGHKVAKDPVEGAKWIRKSADQGYPEAQAVLGEMYASGTGVTKDIPTALGLFRKAAAQGNDRAMHDLGFSYENGIGVEKDPKQALEWYRKVKSDKRTPDAIKRVSAAASSP